jgi:hypothetical protein
MPTADVTVAEEILEACSPSDFEALVATLYENEGYETRVKPRGPDGGVDVIAERHGRERAIQCKRYAGGNPVGGPTVRQTIGAAQTHGADAVSVVTTSRFTTSAKSTVVDVDGIDIELVDGSDLLEWLDGGDVVVEDGEVTIKGTSPGSAPVGDGLMDQLETQLTGNANSQAGQQLEEELTRYIRQRVEDEYKDMFLQKQAELQKVFATKARKAGKETGERIKQSPEAARKQASITWGKAQSTREAALETVSERATAAKDTATEAGETAKEKASETTDAAKEKADEAKEKANKTAGKAKNKASSVKDKFF